MAISLTSAVQHTCTLVGIKWQCAHHRHHYMLQVRCVQAVSTIQTVRRKLCIALNVTHLAHACVTHAAAEQADRVTAAAPCNC
jgi:hypothetical protein